MVKFIAGGKGAGKTRILIDMANKDVKTTDGRLVFIDDDKRHIYDLHRDIRFVDSGKRVLSNYREFIGFVLGILSMDSDIETIYVDGLNNIIKVVENEDLVKLATRLQKLSEENSVNFIICINCQAELLPEEIKELIIRS